MGFFLNILTIPIILKLFKKTELNYLISCFDIHSFINKICSFTQSVICIVWIRIDVTKAMDWSIWYMYCLLRENSVLFLL